MGAQRSPSKACWALEGRLASLSPTVCLFHSCDLWQACPLSVAQQQQTMLGQPDRAKPICKGWLSSPTHDIGPVKTMTYH